MGYYRQFAMYKTLLGQSFETPSYHLTVSETAPEFYELKLFKADYEYVKIAFDEIKDAVSGIKEGKFNAKELTL